jgi:hypothetical protein
MTPEKIVGLFSKNPFFEADFPTLGPTVPKDRSFSPRPNSQVQIEESDTQVIIVDPRLKVKITLIKMDL